MLKKFFYIIAALTSLVVIAAVASYLWLVVYFPGDAVSRENIEKTLAMESPVYYSDGQTKIGVFFQDAHRQYVPYDELPEYFVKGLVAGEDRHFFQHYGVDFPGFFRAMKANVKARRVVQGGSTLTQQAAKNLFKRKGRTVQSKLTELLYALRLEALYTKEEILEFYANQFYVSGNGRGLGVAARYYFDKEPDQLELIESAFIAGSVKRPNYYNPFIKKTVEEVARAKEQAKARTGYVLRHMYRAGMISSELYQQAMAKDVPFNRGKMRFRLNTLMDLVKEGMTDPVVEDALLDAGIENVSTSGMRVVTTIDKNLQKSNYFALQSELSRLDVRLRGYNREELQQRYSELPFGAVDVSAGQFLVGRILDIRPETPAQLEVFFASNAHDADNRGIIDEQGLMPLLDSLVRYKGQRWSQASRKDLPVLLGELKKGDLVYLSVREKDSFSGEVFFNLEKYPDLQGASLMLQRGKLLALAGGMDNYFYNRAVSAKRTMGSSIKPLLYAAAIQLGWNSLDPLHNERAMFVYHNMPYIPKPDHESPHSWVSMSLAGVHSENVASVWLLYHLCDRLNPAQFKELLTHVGLAREMDESYQHYTRRIRDTLGIVVNNAAVRGAAFEKAVAAVEADLIFAGKQEEFKKLGFFRYENDFELAEAKKDAREKTRLEAAVQQKLISRSFVRYRNLQQQLLRDLSSQAQMDAGSYLPKLYRRPFQGTGGGWWSSGERLRSDDYLVYAEEYPGQEWRPVRADELLDLLAGMSNWEKNELLGEVRVDDFLSFSTLNLLQENFQREYEKLAGLPAYGEDVLHFMRDFRVLAGLRYLIGFCRAMGVESNLEPVLSFPLGSNVISLLELARIYESLTGGVHFAEGESLDPGLSIIDRIESSDGEIIYDGKAGGKGVLDKQTSLAVNDILRNVVKFGTGRFAKNNIILHSSSPDVEEQLADLELGVPVLGKTGTANRFTNSTFVGVVPALRDDGSGVILDANSYVLAAYVGFDDNSPMVRTSTHITGAGGALPVWTKMAKSIIFEKDYAGSMDVVDMAFAGDREVPLFYPDLGQIEVAVGLEQGGFPLTAGAGADVKKAPVTTFGRFMPGGEVEPARYFRPFWRVVEKTN